MTSADFSALKDPVTSVDDQSELLLRLTKHFLNEGGKEFALWDTSRWCNSVPWTTLSMLYDVEQEKLLAANKRVGTFAGFWCCKSNLDGFADSQLRLVSLSKIAFLSEAIDGKGDVYTSVNFDGGSTIEFNMGMNLFLARINSGTLIPVEEMPEGI